MLSAILAWLAGPLLRWLGERDDARIAAMNDVERRAHEDRQNARAAATEVRLATSGYWEQRAITTAIVLPFVVHLWLIAWDTMWPQPWNVEKWPAPFDEWGGAILLSYFGVIGLTGSARAIAGALAIRSRAR